MKIEQFKEKLEQGLNTGFIAPPSLEEEPKQWLGGGAVSIPYFIRKPDGNWEIIKITGEIQNFLLFDSMGCVSNSWTNSNDKQIEFFRKNGVVITAGIKDWLATRGVQVETGNYVIDEEKIKDWIDENGKFNTSNRFLAKTSNTSEYGNSPMNVGDAALEYGLPPESVWSIKKFIEEGFNRAEFYKTPPQSVKDFGLRFKELFYTPYERLPDTKQSTFEKYLKRAPIWWASATCSGWQDSEIVNACSLSPNHMTLGQGLKLNEHLEDYDSYNPFDKKLAWNYRIYFPYQMVVFPKMEVLKKKPQSEEESEAYTMKISIEVVKRKRPSDPTKWDYLLRDKKDSSMWHRVGNEKVMFSIIGAFYPEIEELEIADESIGEPIYFSSTLADMINNFFNKLKGK